MKAGHGWSRRMFIGAGSAGLASLACSGCRSVAKPVCGTVRLAAAGVWLPMVLTGNATLVAICDCDRAMVARAAEELKKLNHRIDLASLPFYQDWRAMLDDADRLGIDALTVSVTDHMHAPIAVTAMKKGINYRGGDTRWEK